MSKLSEQDLHDKYDEMLDECGGTIKIGSLEYPASTTLEAVDPIAYRVGFNDWLDGELNETIWEKDDEYFDNEDCEE